MKFIIDEWTSDYGNNSMSGHIYKYDTNGVIVAALLDTKSKYVAERWRWVIYIANDFVFGSAITKDIAIEGADAYLKKLGYILIKANMVILC